MVGSRTVRLARKALDASRPGKLLKQVAGWAGRVTIVWCYVFPDPSSLVIFSQESESGQTPHLSNGETLCTRRYWKKGIGTKVLHRMIERAREVGLEEILVKKIYDWNTGSRKLFEKCGFEAVEKTQKGWSYRLIV